MFPSRLSHFNIVATLWGQASYRSADGDWHCGQCWLPCGHTALQTPRSKPEFRLPVRISLALSFHLVAGVKKVIWGHGVHPFRWEHRPSEGQERGTLLLPVSVGMVWGHFVRSPLERARRFSSVIFTGTFGLWVLSIFIKGKPLYRSIS